MHKYEKNGKLNVSLEEKSISSTKIFEGNLSKFV